MRARRRRPPSRSPLWRSWGEEELVIRAGEGDRLLLAGGRPRGTLYAVSRASCYKDDCGVRWWTAWASRIPHQPSFRVADLDVRAKPAFEYREPFLAMRF